MNNKSGFTLVEILTAVIIVAILTVMAMPLYEKTVERSRLAEARTLMNRLQAAKLYAMDNMECSTYSTAEGSGCPELQHLNMALIDQNKTPPSAATCTTFRTNAFEYSIAPAQCANGISATRKGGEYDGTQFIYYGLRQDGGDAVFVCVAGKCDEYGLNLVNMANCVVSSAS